MSVVCSERLRYPVHMPFKCSFTFLQHFTRTLKAKLCDGCPHPLLLASQFFLGLGLLGIHIIIVYTIFAT